MVEPSAILLASPPHDNAFQIVSEILGPSGSIGPTGPSDSSKPTHHTDTGLVSTSNLEVEPDSGFGWVIEGEEELRASASGEGFGRSIFEQATEEDPFSTLVEEPLGGATIQAYTFDGKPITFRPKVKKAKSNPSSTSRESVNQMLGVPIHRLMENLSNETASRLNRPVPETGRHKHPTHERVEDTLWTDRYRPRHFTELVGDERTHREAMAWVKEWDQCVFGKRVKRRRQEQEDPFQYIDEYHRPREKILLLSGPPGLGKTTLTHVLATQAGYDILEINASDSRSAGTVEDRIRPALESGSKVGSKKPVLVVIDEIDGATGGNDHTSGFIQKLIALTMVKPKKKNVHSKEKNNGQRPLLRPIICICNDLYAPSLSKLRPLARVIKIQKTASVHLVNRLQQICSTEGIRVDSRALSTLVNVTQGDMRGCLNTLQLLGRKHPEINETMVQKATRGIKEADRSFISVLSDIFSPLPQSRVKDLGLTIEEAACYVGRISRGIEGTGNMDKVALACFEHYTTLRTHEASFRAYEQAQDWLATYDLMNGAIRTDREYGILPYLPYTLAAFHPLFRTKGGGKVERPKVDWEAFVVQKNNQEIYKSLSKSIATAGGGRRSVDYRHLTQEGVMHLEFVPMLNRIISPPLRPVNHQVIKKEDKCILSRVVDVMVALELRFVQEQQDDGQMMYRLEPPIDVFVTYDGKRAKDIAVSRYATRHVIAGEIDAQLIVRDAEAMQLAKSTMTSAFFKRNQNEDTPLSPVKTGTTKPVKTLSIAGTKRARETEVDIADRPPTDFFGRLLIQKPKSTIRHQGPMTSRVTKASYKFNEGNSAAVRKPVKISSLLK